MPAGEPYFAWVDASETTFGPEHMRWDESVFSFTCEQSEGDPASLTAVVRRPRNVSGDPIGLLGPGRKIWAWFAIDCGSALFKFRGRLVGVPTSIFEELVTLEFIARPFDVVAQKQALAESLKVLPFYDELVIDPEQRNDPEVVLEGYSKIWHYDRETHVLTVSDEIVGEDGLVEFDGASEGGKVLYDGLGLTLTSGPLSRVDLSAEFTWTQQAYGTVDLTKYIQKNWPGNLGPYQGETFTSFTLDAGSWPKSGAGLGDGWTVSEASAREMFDTEVSTVTEGGNLNVDWWDGEGVSVSSSSSTASMRMQAPGSIQFQAIVTAETSQVTYATDELGTYPASFSYNFSSVKGVLPCHHVQATLLAGYTAERPCTEQVTISLVADVQHILTDPEDGEALRLDGIKSVNLSEAGSDGIVPIGDPRRRSYIATARGNQSIEHLISLARTHLLKRSRVVEISFAPKLERMAEITLRKNAFIIEPRIGEATGKIIGYTLALDGADGRINCEVRIGCAIGRAGSQIAAGGDPTYAEEAYTGADYQQYTGRIVLFDSSVGYAPPNADPDDDGIDFMSVIAAEDVIDQPLVVENTAAVQWEFIQLHADTSGFNGLITGPAYFLTYGADYAQQLLQARNQAATDALKLCETKATFKLKSMTRDFATPYDIQVTDVKIPTGYNLEAV
jgi:hypothetical protein